MNTYGLLILFFFLPQDPPPARASWQAGGALRISLSAEVFDHQEVSRYLASGLTTTFRVEVRGRNRSGQALKREAAVAVRYELWDEAYLVHYLDSSGVVTRHEFTSLTLFKNWWRERVLTVEGLRPLHSGVFRVVLEVIPFSAHETEVARDWLTSALAEPSSNLGGSLVNTVVATSIQRKVLIRFQWRIAATGVESP